MAIGFARLEFVKRTNGQTACAKAAYNSRDRVNFVGNELMAANIYDWSHMEKPIYHEIILPKHVDNRFKEKEALWNVVENKETRINSQTALDMVLALPDDEAVSEENRIELTKSFVEKHLIEKGLAAQIDIHRPTTKEKGNKGHNWHAHVLITTRRFTEDGKDLGEKARDLVPVIRGGKVISGPKWEYLWTQHQNQYFESKGISLQVDPKGAVGQIHLGPIRMRGRAFALLEENEQRIELNYIESSNPQKILERITETRSVFSVEDLERFMSKHVDPKNMPQVRESFWKQDSIIELIDKKNGLVSGKYTTQQIHEEENRILRLADRIHDKGSLRLNKEQIRNEFSKELNQEQTRAYQNILAGERLACIEGHAGTGKSYLMGALKKTYESNGYTIRAFGPDNATAEVLNEKGFSNAENVYKFLFAYQNDKRDISANKEVWMIDEAGKLGNRPLAEILKIAEKHKVQIILAGCSAQMSSVERGGMFKILCERFGAQILEDIQRQKEESHKEIAKKLAQGRMAEAIDGIVATGGLRWASDKKEAIEELSKKWAMDRLTCSGAELIIAHTNSEVRALNEMVRLYRKQQGEIEEKEYQCDTAFGKIYVSVGDKLEFRKNDQELGVTNGMSGVLVKASSNKFVISVKNGENSREIAFDPSTYTHFQLGYAATFYRSQGRTVDRAYVLHSPQMHKEMFYVGLTRHVRHVHLFVAKTDAKCLADLKRQAFRASLVETSLAYTTKDQIEKEKAQQAKIAKIGELKESESMISMAKGYGLAAWDGLLSKTQGTLEKIRDRNPSKQFFNPVLPEESQKTGTRVTEVKDSDPIDLPKESLDKQKRVPTTSKPMWLEKREEWSALPEAAKNILKDYQKSWQYASALRDDLNNNKQKSTSAREWHEACATRNELAYKVLQTASKDELRNLLGNEAFEIILERSLRHEAVVQKIEKANENLEEKLKLNIDALLYKLFPEGPTRKDNQGFRYGTKGSLAVACRGKNMGCYHDFEKGDGGGPLNLIQKALGIGYIEAKDWARNFLGEAKEFQLPPKFNHTKAPFEKSGDWKSLKPPANIQPPSLKEVSTKLDAQYNETARHAYRDEKGHVLFYTLRLHEKDNPSSKIVLPLSYGCWKGEKENPTWWLKGYQLNEGRPLYNLHELTKNTTANVLVVEGEKTADAAAKMFEKDNMVCITWAGGSDAVSKTNWGPLYGRQVIIWPDNDQAGYKASDEICSALRQVGVKSLEVVDKNIISKDLPAKWDLADPLPAGKSDQYIRDMLLQAQEKTVNADQFILSIGSGKQVSFIEELQAREILWRVEERLRPFLEQKDAKPWDIRDQIIKEAQRVCSNREELEKKLLENGTSGDLNKRLAYHVLLYQARTGDTPTQSNLDELKQTLTNCFKIQDRLYSDCKQAGVTKDICEHAVDKCLSNAFVAGKSYGKETPDSVYTLFKNDVLSYAKNMSKQANVERNQPLEISKDRSQEITLV